MAPPRPAGPASSPRASRGLLLLLALFALAIRLIGLDFDQNHFFHPDERAIGDAILKLSFHPLQLNPHFFAYGSLPFYLTKGVSSLLAALSGRDWFASYDGVVHVGRFLSALAGALTVLLIAAVGRRLYGQKAGLLAGLLLALAVLHIQTSHFASTDVTLTLFVLLALAASGRLARRGRARDALFAGALTGFALATKVSAAPLLLPVAVAVFLACRPARAWRKGVLLLGAGGLAFAVAFFLGEPYAFLDFKVFWHSLSEQGAMVRHAGVMPYTNQYVGVPNFLYEAREIVLWGLGPLFGLAALWAAGRRLVLFRKLSDVEWVFASFFVPYVLLTCTFEVKFPRYLLPVYPLFALWTAAWLMEKAERGRAGRILRAVVVGGTAVWALAFASIYTRPHSFATASLWFHDHVPDGAHVLEQDWDEGFPFAFPGRPPERYKIVSFGFYEPDAPEKMAKLAKELADADWVVLQTKRLYGAVTRAPEKFPFTNRAFRLLFAGNLGYTLAREFASRPSVFGIPVPDELADESFTVYDHPKVLLFENTKRLSEGTLEKALLSATPSKTLTRDDLLLARPSGTAAAVAAAATAVEPGPGVPARRSSFVALLLFAVWLEAVSLAGAGLLAVLLPARPGRDALGRVTGVLLFAFLPWLLVSWRWASFTRGLLFVTTAALLAAGFLCRRRAGATAPAPERRKTALVFWGTFLFFLAVRSLNPEIFSGEKPMDFSFLNTLLRSTELPPPEPWLAGTPLSYTYFGHFLAAAAGKLLGIHPGLLFNLAIAMTAALAASAILAAGAALGGRLRTGAVAVLLALFVAPPSGPRTAFDFQFHQAHRPLDWHYFWATSRVIPPNAISEYPFWSFLYADLHAHVLALPFTAAFVAVLLLFVTRERNAPFASRQAASLVALAGLFFGALQITNGWSTPVYACLLLFLPGALWLGTRPPGFAASTLTLARSVVLPVAGVALSAALLARPFWARFSPPPRNWGREVGPWAQPWDFFNVWAFFIALLVPFAFVAWRTGAVPLGRAARAFLILAAVALPLSLMSFSLHPPQFGQVRSVSLFTAAAGLIALGAALRRATDARLRPALALAAFGFAVLTGCELVFVWDRMNTVFKFHFETWLLFSIAGALAWEAFLSSKSLAWRLAVGVTGFAALFTTVTALSGFLRLDRGGWPRRTLDGTAYLEKQNPGDRGAIEWINANVRGLPVLLEAQGPAYQEFTRLTMHTGLPTVLGWEYHTFQRGHSQAEIDRRKEEVAAAYTSGDEAVVARVLSRYHVALVAVGNLERRTYAGGNLARFEKWTDLLTPVYRNPEIVLFAVKGVFAPGAAPAPVRVDELPPSTRREETPPPAEAAGQVRQPRGAASDAAGRVWVADFGNQRVQVFGADGSPAFALGTRGSGPGQFNDPCGVAVGPSGLVFVADTWNGRVQVLDEKGGWLREWGGGFFGPRGIAVDAGGTVFVSDTGNGRVVRFDGFGHKEAEWGTAAGPGKLADPQGLVTGKDGKVYVADNGNGRVAIFDRDGGFVRAFAVPGWRREVFSEPYVALDSVGLLWASVPLAGEVRAYTAEGRLVTTLRGRDLPEGQRFEKPSGLALLPKGRLFVADLEGRFAIVSLPK
jgi:YYY domain-containing protein